MLNTNTVNGKKLDNIFTKEKRRSKIDDNLVLESLNDQFTNLHPKIKNKIEEEEEEEEFCRIS